MPMPGSKRSRMKRSVRAFSTHVELVPARAPTRPPCMYTVGGGRVGVRAGADLIGKCSGVVLAALLTMAAGDAATGRNIVMNRQISACLLCHAAPFPNPHLQGTLAPSLAGVGSRMTADALRLRLTTPPPDSIMPSYSRVTGLNRVGTAWDGKPLLTPAQIEDVVAFLTTLSAP